MDSFAFDDELTIEEVNGDTTYCDTGMFVTSPMCQNAKNVASCGSVNLAKHTCQSVRIQCYQDCIGGGAFISDLN